jgi:hypothetical protein
MWYYIDQTRDGGGCRTEDTGAASFTRRGPGMTGFEKGYWTVTLFTNPRLGAKKP